MNILTSFHQATTAQIVPDNTLGRENSTVTNQGLRDIINGGAIRGDNIFHSFQEFNVNRGQQLYFANPDGVNNILTRVTGNNLSKINTFAKIKRAFCSRVMFTRLQLKYPQEAHAKYISTTGMLTTTYNKNNFETVE